MNTEENLKQKIEDLEKKIENFTRRTSPRSMTDKGYKINIIDAHRITDGIEYYRVKWHKHVVNKSQYSNEMNDEINETSYYDTNEYNYNRLIKEKRIWHSTEDLKDYKDDIIYYWKNEYMSRVCHNTKTIYRCISGMEYVGGWKHGYHGRGKLKYICGRIFEGKFKYYKTQEGKWKIPIVNFVEQDYKSN